MSAITAAGVRGVCFMRGGGGKGYGEWGGAASIDACSLAGRNGVCMSCRVRYARSKAVRCRDDEASGDRAIAGVNGVGLDLPKGVDAAGGDATGFGKGAWKASGLGTKLNAQKWVSMSVQADMLNGEGGGPGTPSDGEAGGTGDDDVGS